MLTQQNEIAWTNMKKIMVTKRTKLALTRQMGKVEVTKGRNHVLRAPECQTVCVNVTKIR